MARCFVCDFPIPAESEGGWTVCPSCNVGFDHRRGSLSVYRDELAALMAQETVLMPRSEFVGPSGWRIRLFGLRLAASRFDRVLSKVGMRGSLVHRIPSKLFNIAFPEHTLRLEPMEEAPGAAGRLAFGCIAPVAEADRLAWFLSSYARLFSQFIFVLDGEDRDADAVRERLAAMVPAGVELIVRARPLAGDYGAQRNLVQSLATKRWVLQLDTDEQLDAGMIRHLGAIADDAEHWRSKVVGFPRFNLVDEKLSNFYPDVQYRLNRSDVRFESRVHETPAALRDWRRVSVCFAGHIEHRLSRDRVVERSRCYEAIAAGGGRPYDEQQLLLPYRP